MDEYRRQVKGDVIRGLNTKFSSSITYSENKVMRELLDNQSKVIGPAYKESGIVMMDTNKYIDQLENEMISNASYDGVKEDRIKQITNKTKKLVKSIHQKGHITSKLRHFLLLTEKSSGKLQANLNIIKKNHPFRTVLNGCQHSTEK